jgi:hypothetical protein
LALGHWQARRRGSGTGDGIRDGMGGRQDQPPESHGATNSGEPSPWYYLILLSVGILLPLIYCKIEWYLYWCSIIVCTDAELHASALCDVMQYNNLTEQSIWQTGFKRTVASLQGSISSRTYSMWGLGCEGGDHPIPRWIDPHWVLNPYKPNKALVCCGKANPHSHGRLGLILAIHMCIENRANKISYYRKHHELYMFCDSKTLLFYMTYPSMFHSIREI